MCANDIGVCVLYDGAPAMIASNPCMSTADDVELFKLKEMEGGDFDSCLIVTPNSFVRFDYASWQGSLASVIGGRRLGGDGNAAPVPKTNVKVESQISLPLVDTGRAGSEVELETVDGEVVASVRGNDGSVLASRPLKDGPTWAETNVKLCVKAEPAEKDGSAVFLEACAPTIPCTRQIIADIDSENRIFPKIPSALLLEEAEPKSTAERLGSRMMKITGWRFLCVLCIFVGLLFLSKRIGLVDVLPEPFDSVLDVEKIGFHFKRAYFVKRYLWFEQFPLDDDELLFRNCVLDKNDCIAGYVAYRRSQCFVGSVFSVIAAVMFLEGAVLLQYDSATDMVGEAAKFKDAAPGPLRDMLNDAQAVILVEFIFALIKILWPTISAIACWRCFSKWEKWTQSDAAVLNCFALRIFLSAGLTILPWFHLPLTDPETAQGGFTVNGDDRGQNTGGWRMLTAILVNWPGISLCLGLTKALLRAIQTLAFVFPVTVISRQMQIVAPLVAALFLWPAMSVLGHMSRNVFLLYGFQLRLFAPCVMSIWAFVFQMARVERVAKSSSEEMDKQTEVLEELRVKRARLKEMDAEAKANGEDQKPEVRRPSRARTNTLPPGMLSSQLDEMSQSNGGLDLLPRRRSSVGQQLEEITAEFYTSSSTTIAKLATRCLNPLSNVMIIYGIYSLQEDILGQGITFFINSALPLLFMFLSDTIFLELVATDVLMHCSGRLSIFNGFMDQDEDFHVLLKLLGFSDMTGRGTAGGLNNIAKSLKNPLRKSQGRLTTHGLPTARNSNGPGLPTGRHSNGTGLSAEDRQSLNSTGSGRGRRNSDDDDAAMVVSPRARSKSAASILGDAGASIFSAKLTSEFEAVQTEVDNLEDCQEALLQLCETNLSSDERAEWIGMLRDLEEEMGLRTCPDDSPDDVLHAL
jgi:hypothetical protein